MYILYFNLFFVFTYVVMLIKGFIKLQGLLFIGYRSFKEELEGLLLILEVYLVLLIT